jgi:hypothetical protein
MKCNEPIPGLNAPMTPEQKLAVVFLAFAALGNLAGIVILLF